MTPKQGGRVPHLHDLKADHYFGGAQTSFRRKRSKAEADFIGLIRKQTAKFAGCKLVFSKITERLRPDSHCLYRLHYRTLLQQWWW